MITVRFLLAFTLSMTAFAGSYSAPPRLLGSYVVFATGNIEYVCSSLKGPIAATGNISLNRIGAGETAFCSDQGVYSRCTSLSLTSLDVGAMAAELSNYASSVSGLGAVTPQLSETGELSLPAKMGQNVFRVDLSVLDKATAVTIEGARGASLLVQVTSHSTDVTWSPGSRIQLKGGIQPSSVMFVLSEAKRLTLRHGVVPGSVMAPRASAQFSEGRVEGTLYVGGDLTGNPAGLSPYDTLACGPGRRGGTVTGVAFNP